MRPLKRGIVFGMIREMVWEGIARTSLKLPRTVSEVGRLGGADRCRQAASSFMMVEI